MVAIIDYDMGNVKSIYNMLKKIGVDAIVTAEADILEKAERYILPGVGAFDIGMENLHRKGLIPLLQQGVIVEKKPILGICLGMQLLTQRSDEGELPGLGWVDAETIKFNPQEMQQVLPIPHMGWNQAVIHNKGMDTLFQGLENNRFYFVHSYYVRCHDRASVLATAKYGMEFDCSIAHGNVFGVQFHPEKSHKFGMKLLENFCGMGS